MRSIYRHLAWGALAMVALCAPSRAQAQSLTLPGTQPGTLTTPLAAAGQCTECHGGNHTSDGRTYMPSDTWPTSMMANAVRDPLFLATLTDAEQDHPGLGTFCLRCHTPGGFTAGHATPGDGSALDPFNDVDGVHCDTCHRSIDASATDPMAPYIGDARLFFDDGAGEVAPTRHGPRSDPFLSPRHPSVGDPFTTDSRLCGQCHDLDNPLVHRLAADGTDTGANFPLQSTYTEWLQSRFSHTTDPNARTCQACHMPVEPGSLAAANIPGAPARTGVHRHDFFGANEWGMALMKAVRPGEMDDAFDAARAGIRTFLQTAATVDPLTLPATVNAGEAIHLTVHVTNNTGHKLPTGYEDSRLMWLQVQAGATVVSGSDAEQVDASTGDPQLHAYRFVPGHIDATTHAAVRDDFVSEHTVVLEDTRIPPAGMLADARTMPVGRDYSGGAGGALRNDDTATYTLTAPETNGPLTVTVRLMYRTTTQHYVDTIAHANHTDGRGTALEAAWVASGQAPPFAIATATTTITVAGGTTPDAGTGDADAATGDAAASDAGTGDAATGDVATSGDAGHTPSGGGCGCATAGGAHREGRALGALVVLGVGLVRRRRRATSRRG